jgi:hypothetical protein
MTYKATFLATAIAAAALSFGVSANAAPFGGAKPAGLEQTQLQKVDYRGYRHCHWRNGRRWCHGGYRRGYWGPGVSLYFGPRWGSGRRYWGHRHYGGHWHRHHRRW